MKLFAVCAALLATIASSDAKIVKRQISLTDNSLPPSIVTFEATNPTEYISFNSTTASSAKLQILPASGQLIADSFLFGIRQVTKSLNQEYIGCFVADTTATASSWFSTAGTALTTISTTECFNKASANKARYFGITKNNQCYFGDGATYSNKGLQPALQCMFDNTGKAGTQPNGGDNASFAMYEISYSRTSPVIDSVLIGSSVL